MGMEPYQERLAVERKDLCSRMEKLRSFMGSDEFRRIDSTDKWLIERQRQIMFDYRRVLDSRIERLTAS